VKALRTKTLQRKEQVASWAILSSVQDNVGHKAVVEGGVKMTQQNPVTTVERKEQGTTRQSILRLLRHHGQMTATELSQELNIGAVGVRQHLALLERDGLVEVAGLRRSIGRPSHLYTLTSEAERCFPKSYDRLAINLLNHIEQHGGEGAIAEALSTHRQQMLQSYTSRMTGKTLEERIAELSSMLNEQGHMSEYEQLTDGTFALTIHNCPVDCVASQYGQLCAQDKELYQELLGATLTRESSIAEGDIYCRYHISA
jgi:predicted ArsR family transcriptional regulator